MIRRLNSITATIALTIAIGILLGYAVQQAVSLALPAFGIARQQTVDARFARLFPNMPGRIAALVDVLNRTPENQREVMLRAAQRPIFHARLMDGPLPGVVDDPGAEAVLLKQRVQQALSPPPRPVIVARRYRYTEIFDGQETWVENGVSVEISLADGQWVIFHSTLNLPDPVDPVAERYAHIRLAAWIATSLALAGLVTWVASCRVVRPLSRLAAAAEHLSVSGDAPQIVTRGPREVEQVIEAFNDMQDRLRRFTADRTRMIAALSHDLRTPLTRLKERIETNALPDQERVLADLDAMNRMIESVLSFARDETRSEPRSLVDLSALVEGLCLDAADAGEPVSFSGPRGVTLLCRPTALRRAFGNLDNAVKYGKSASVTLTEEPGHVIITVADEGPGIPRYEREKVFEPFYRVDAARDPDQAGVGLGLSVARSILWEHGGEVRLESRATSGLSVIVSLPTVPESRVE